VHFKRFVGLACACALVGFAFIPAAASARFLTPGTAGKTTYTIQGAGSTLVAPLEAEWAAAWDNATGNTVTYNPVGSGTGYQDIAGGLVDFGASDAPLSAYSSPSCSHCVQIPWGLTATGVSFNINNLKVTHLHLTGQVLALIYLGKITNWDDSRIGRLNPGAHLPHLHISVFWRNDASGDSFAFSKYLSDISSTFNSRVGASTQPSFPVGTGAHGNGGMASAVQTTNGAIAYVAVSYLANDGLPAAGIKNSAGNYEVPNLGPIEDAASVVHSVPSNNQLTIVDPPPSAHTAYAISTFTYVMLPTTASRAGGVPAGPIKNFIYYALHGGQSFAASLDFAHIPKVVLTAADNTLGRVH
jgi:phosphate transport system substrate-binding protein